MTDFIADLNASGYRGEEARRARDYITKGEAGRRGATYSGGVMRWASNGSVPPREHVALAAFLGFPVDPAACEAARSAEIRELAASLRRREATMSAEDRAERAASARAAHGPGVELVNVLTGARFRT